MGLTGRHIILYILEHHLEDAVVDGWLTPVEVAEKFNVGIATVATWISENKIEHISVLGQVFIPYDAIPEKIKERSHE